MMQCPQCDTLLCTIDYEGIEIETCPDCEGEWLDDGELKHVVKAREVLFSKEERRAIAAATKITGVKVEDVDRDLTCPNCGGQTDAINYGGDTGIIIDRCTGCRGICWRPPRTSGGTPMPSDTISVSGTPRSPCWPRPGRSGS